MASTFASGRPALGENLPEDVPGDLLLLGARGAFDLGEVVLHFLDRRAGVERGAQVEVELPGRSRHGAERPDRRELAVLGREVVANENVAEKVFLQEGVDRGREDLIARGRRNFRTAAQLRAHLGAVLVLVDPGGDGRRFPTDFVLDAGVGAALRHVHEAVNGVETAREARVGDTVTLANNPCSEALPGYRAAQPMVFCGVYPADGAHYGDLRDALEKLQLNDAALSFEPETSVALGFGFRCGFLGLLHMEIIQERLEREYNLDLITTAPSVVYHIEKTDGTVVAIDNPTNYPDPTEIRSAEEPMANAHIYSPSEYVGSIMELCQERRGVYKDMTYIEADRVDLHYLLPLNEIIYDFFDVLKSRTRGYASFDYELAGYQKSNLVKLDIMLNGEIVDALSFIIHADKAYPRARRMAEKLAQKIPRQLFEVPIQACIGGRIIARETVKALRKDVLAKCYGGDITRKKKLLEKQKEGKKRMRQLGTVEVPQEAFMSVLKLEDDS